MQTHLNLRRRQILQGSLLSGGMATAAGLVSFGATAAGKASVHLQLGWLPGINQAGDVCAKRLGYYEQEGLELTIHPGGPHFDGIATVVSGRFHAGQVSSSPSVMLAVSQGLPIRCFAVGAQRHPYCYFSLPQNPVRKPADLAGKRVGIQPTAAGLLRAVLARNGVSEKDVQVVPIGGSMAPLKTGQVDVVTGWLTNTSALKVLGEDRVEMSLWDAGVRLYALPYYADAAALRREPEVFERFLRATARGWRYALDHRDAAVDLMVREYPNLDRATERVALDTMLTYSFGGLTATQGWGAMDPSLWQHQIDLFAQLGLFTAPAPALADVMTLDVLRATQAARMQAA